MQTPNPSLLLGTSLCSLLFLLRAFHSSTSVRSPAAVHSSSPFGPPPRLAYFVTGSAGDASRMLRLLRTIYHPRNQYLLHLDLAAPAAQRRDLALAVRSVDAYVAFRNVNVVERADRVDRAGSTALASMLHGAAVLLRYSSNWDWFVNLDASSYPLITQDGFVNSNLRFVAWDNPPGDEPRYLNFGDLSRMMQSGAVFARKFREDDPILDKIDKKILHRCHDRFAPGGWCIGRDVRGRDPCQVWGDPDILRPGLLAKRLEKLLLTVLSNSSFHSNQCVYK